jgi:DNA-directed RNA polymerase subunit RPC12/RpoP
MNNFNIECPYCGGRMILKEVPNMKCMSYYCEDCIAIIHLTHYDEEYVKEFLNTVKKKKDKVE